MRSRVCLALLAAYLALPGCILPPATSTGGGRSPASSGPDGVQATEAVSTLPARIAAGVEWLWASYTALQAKGAVPGLADLRADIVDLEAVATRGDLLAALDLYGRARARVTAIAEVASK
ncbi:hypothetical protein DFW101_3532 [Solidesulfovibrio carbinoliphilus subsp. oakridgensis]|uniref:Lipoprotein n=1 Tax=Solidesulfovibrio carbinoliphilus subsp. oakridgensis TaxID=694327 RepID=G7QC82_9BACT|nr:hypothetical protein DFW101_3532 [Solidesulfovibrio carbinoliphilus subsp. oakridgensis]